jgi:hypothetical protein
MWKNVEMEKKKSNVVFEQDLDIECTYSIKAFSAIVENGGELHLRAGNNITLASGFSAQHGSTFSAQIANIDDCGDAYKKSATQKSLIIEQTDSVINLQEGKFSMQIYPNPTQQNCFIKFYLPVDDEVVIDVVNIYGQKIMENKLGVVNQGTHEQKLSLPNVSQGLYFVILSLQRTGKNSTDKLIISQ